MFAEEVLVFFWGGRGVTCSSSLPSTLVFSFLFPFLGSSLPAVVRSFGVHTSLISHRLGAIIKLGSVSSSSLPHTHPLV